MMALKPETKHIMPTLFKWYIILILLSVVVIACSAIPLSSNSSFNEKFVGWTLENGDVADIEEINDDVSFFNTIPMIDTDQTLFFRAKNIIVSVFIDGEMIANPGQIEMEHNLNYKAPGTYYVTVPILREYSGKQIEIRVESPYKNDSSCNIKDIQIGNISEILLEQIKVKLPGFCACVIIIAFGVAFIIIDIVINKRNTDNNKNSLIYLGAFAVTTGLWSMTETKMLQLIFGNSTFWHLITGILLLLMITPIFLFFKERHNVFTLLPVIVTNGITISMYVISMILHYGGDYDLHELIWLAHLCIISGVVFTLYYAFRCCISTKFKDTSFWGLLIIAICAGADVVLYRFQITQDNSTIVRIGILGYVGFLGFEILKDYIKRYHYYLKVQLLNKMAYYDILTDFYNRASFTQDTEKINEDIGSNIGRIVAIFDLNNLKYINDTLGHSCGDLAITEASEVIKKYFGDFGKCYRIGGDEFALITDSTYIGSEEIIEVHKRFEKEFIERNNNLTEEKPWMLMIAFGFGILSDGDTSMQIAFDKADKNMYSNKTQLKERYKDMNLHSR